MESKIILTSISLEEIVKDIRAVLIDELKNLKNSELEEKLLSPAEVCKLFQPSISKVTLTKWTKSGDLQEYRIGGRVYYKYTEVLESLKSIKKYKRA